MTIQLPGQINTEKAMLSEQARAVAAGLSSRSIAPDFVAGIVQAIEFVVLMLIGGTLSFVATDKMQTLGWGDIAVALGGPLIAVVAIRSGKGYSFAALRDPVASLGRMLIVWSLVITLVAAAGFFLNLGSGDSRGWLAAFYVIGSVYLIAERGVIASLVTRWTREGRLERRAVIVGGGDEAAALIQSLEADSASGIRICGIFDDRSDARSPDEVAGHPKLGTVAELVAFARLARVDLLIVSFPVTAETRLLQVLKKLSVLPVDIRLSALGSRLRFRPRAYSYIGQVPFLDMVDRPISGWDALAKRAFDIAFSLIGLLLLSPVMLITAIAIRIDSPGPILFRQRRYGFNNEVIEVWKFRSMYHHLRDPAAKVAVTRDDPRVTRVGRFIRRSSIDELPQLVNVLTGKLSLVGPRPHAVNAHTGDRLWDEVVDDYFARHKVKPGITGWAQVNGWRGEIDTSEKIRRRVEYDLEYIDRWSVLFDFYIVLVTPVSLVRGENAY